MKFVVSSIARKVASQTSFLQRMKSSRTRGVTGLEV